MAKENRLLFIISLYLLIIPNMGFGNTAIKTTQRSIVIDPGHGGTDSGLVSNSGIEEKTIALRLAQKTAQRLESRYNVILTRITDINIPVRERVFMANQNSVDLFLSIHLHDSNPSSGYFFYFAPAEPDMPATDAPGNSWKSQSVLHQSESKLACVSFFNIFSTHKKTERFYINGAPIIFLEGAIMPALLIEPLSISILPQHPEEIETFLDEYVLLILKSIDLYFKKI